MYELIQLSEHDYYVDSPAKVGIIRVGEKEVVLIDSGSDKDAAKKVLKHIQENDWTLRAIYVTHSHSDHIGGCRLLHERTGCAVYAPGMDHVYASYPILEPITLYGGLPFKDLKNKFLLAEQCMAEEITDENLPQGFSVIELPGHSMNMVGFRTPDDNVFIADSVSTKTILDKYGVSFLWDHKNALASLEYLKTVEAKCFVPAHAPVMTDIAEIVEDNIAAINRVVSDILGICETPKTFEALLKALFDKYGIAMNAQQYVLIGSTVRSYLAGIYTDGQISFEFKDNEMLWQTVK